MSKNKAVIWDIDTTSKEVIKESISGPAPISLEGIAETAFNPDLRQKVEEEHYTPGGKYRSVLKVHARYGGQDEKEKSWTAGTGWLIEDDLVVTAGHVVLSPENRGRAVYLNTYAGYRGLDSIGSSVGEQIVQKRQGKRIAVPEAYFNNKNDTYDVAFVKLIEPFENVQPFRYRETPEEGSRESIGVVGYPADNDSNDGNNGVGPHMYEQFIETSWNLRESDSYLLQYGISTFHGQSGGPVILETGFQCIGTHTQGFKEGFSKNSASPIGGQYGTPYDALATAIKTELKLEKQSDGIWRIPLPSLKSRKPGAGAQRTSISNVQSTPREKEHVYAALKFYDTVFLVDDSDSMKYPDPTGGTRWDTAKMVIGEIASIAVDNDSDGIDMHFFNHTHKFKNLKSTGEVMDVFRNIVPYGSTLTANKLEGILNQYCYNYKKDRESMKCLNLIVLTDGDPDPRQDVAGVIIKYAQKLEALEAPSYQVGIQFVQIGDDPKAAAFLREIDDNLKGRYGLDRDVSKKRT
ncbi:MAG: hypothetical protein Q9214_002442 [Letrouitia sp. 1 TL-2023]